MAFTWLLFLLFLICLYPIYNIHQQPNAKLPNFHDELRDLNWGQLNFLHTTDTHSWYLGHTNQKQYSADWGDFISFTSHMRLKADELGVDLLVLDTGDKHDGNGLGDVTDVNGLHSDRIFVRSKFDMLTIGNHELYVEEITEREFIEVVPQFKDNYVCTNVDFIQKNGKSVPFGKRYKVIHTKNQNLKILGLGILFNFERKNSKARVTPILQLIHLDWFKELMISFQNQELDLILVIGHIPVSHDWLEFQQLHNFLRSYYPDLPIQYFGGHSHIRDFVKLDRTSHGLQSGRYCETVGWLSIKDLKLEQNLQVDRKYIDFNLHSFMHHSNKTSDDFLTLDGSKTSNELAKVSTELDLNHIYGLVPNNYLLNALPIEDEYNLLNFLSNKILIRLVPKFKERNSLPKLSDSRIIIINTGSIRYDLYKGPFTKNSKYIVSPFKNKWRFISLVPRKIALKVLDILNDADYLMSELSKVKSGQLEPFMLNLRREESKYLFDSSSLSSSSLPHSNDDYFQFRRRSYGYVTHDDFGTDGDDTIHRSFAYYQEPNVIQSLEGDGEFVDVIYYDFIERQVVFSLQQLSYEVEETALYNDLKDEYNVGQLLQDYIQENWK